ncbi:hypothetical protein FGO68_gene16919 [Halteria grandinella]|uniref:Uncharacterized protein n=1 Tax=Halteria grandinella TaxID=5974 RepID=A0A8J8P6C5_HALGN|nr:hypothetical protein FGO68_gene16919 [Halteria grandinella]
MFQGQGVDKLQAPTNLRLGIRTEFWNSQPQEPEKARAVQSFFTSRTSIRKDAELPSPQNKGNCCCQKHVI